MSCKGKRSSGAWTGNVWSALALAGSTALLLADSEGHLNIVWRRQIDLQAMKQTNLQTGQQRNVRRVEGACSSPASNRMARDR